MTCTAKKISDVYVETGELIIPPEPAVVKGRGPGMTNAFDITFSDGSVLTLTVRTHKTGIASGRDSVGVYWAPDDKH